MKFIMNLGNPEIRPFTSDESLHQRLKIRAWQCHDCESFIQCSLCCCISQFIFLVYPHDWVSKKIILFYLSVQSISPTHPRPKDDPCAAALLPADTIENLHKLCICLYWNYLQHPEPAGWRVVLLCIWTLVQANVF